MYPEYLALFSNNGPIKIQVSFMDSDSSIADFAMESGEIQKLFDQTSGRFYEKMYFDDHLLDIYKFVIDPSNNTIKIKAR
jgi:hypothetical protein